MKINLGCGRKRLDDYVGVDCTQIVDGKGNKMVDVVVDIEREHLPYPSNSVDEILADNVLEHIGNLQFVLNDCHRVLKEKGFLWGVVPIANSGPALRDPTHKRVFVKETFDYFCGVNPALPHQPSHPKYADYGFKPWHLIDLRLEGDLIHFKMSPRKV